MEFGYTEEQTSIRELARQILGDEVTNDRLIAVQNGPDGMDRDLWKQLADASLLGVAIDEELGGAGFGVFELCLLLEEQGRVVAPVPLVPTLVYGAMAIAEFGSDEQRKLLLPEIAAGNTVLTAGLHETGCVNPARPRTIAEAKDGGWRLDGEKTCVPYANVAQRILVPARTEDGGVGVFLVDPAAAGVALERHDTTNHEPWCTVRLDGVVVPAEDLLGDPHEGAAIVAWMVARGRLALSALQLGVLEEALVQTAEYTRTRKQFGKPIGGFQGVSLRAADGYIDVQALRSALWQAAWRVASGLPAEREVLAARWWAQTAGHRVVHTAQHLHGGTGADVDYPIHRFFLWSKQNELMLGGAGRQLEELGDRLAAGDQG